MTGTAIPAFLFGGPEILIVVLILVVLFWGPKKIPELARSTGEATKEWKKGREELENELEEEKEKEKEAETA